MSDIDYPANGAFGATNDQWDKQTQALRRLHTKLDRLTIEQIDKEREVEAFGKAIAGMVLLEQEHDFSGESKALRGLNWLMGWTRAKRLIAMDELAAIKKDRRETERSISKL